MSKHYHIIFHLAFCLLLCCFCAPGNATEKTSTSGNAQAGRKAVWVWAEQSGSENAVFLSRQVGETWEKPQKISVKEGVNVVPAVANTSGANLMVVWTNFSGSQAQLRYRQLKDGLWSEEKEFYTGLTSNTSPSISVDGTGKIWIVWAGFNGISDEIYYSSWNGTSFATATAITANDIPDIQPVLGMDEETGNPSIQWLQFSHKGYVKYESTWNGSAWSKPTPVPAITPSSTAGEAASGTTAKTVVLKKTGSEHQASKTAAAPANQLEVEIPEFVTVPESASIHIPGYTVHSLPIRSVVGRR